MEAQRDNIARACGWCGALLPDDGIIRKYCTPTHRRKASDRRNGKPTNVSLRQESEKTQDRRGARHPLNPNCAAKHAYPTTSAAEFAIRAYLAGVGTRYECGDHWHITRRPLNAPAGWREAYGT